MTAPRRRQFGLQAAANSWLLPLVVSGLTMLIALLPFLWHGQSTVVRFHDHLDSAFTYAAVIARDHLIFASGTTIVPDIMGGLKRWYFDSPFSLYLWLFAVLPPFKAMVANELLMRMVAFWGLYRLLRDDVASSPAAKWPALLAAVCFALNPFFPSAQGSVAGIPLAAWSAQRVRRDGFSFVAIATLTFFVLYSLLVLAGIFFLAAVSLVALYDLLHGRRAQAMRLVGFAAIGALLYLIREHQLLQAMVSPAAEVVQRVEMQTVTMGAAEAARAALSVFLTGQHHALTYAAPFILAGLAAALVVAGWHPPEAQRAAFKTILTMLGSAIATSLLYAIWRLSGMQNLVAVLHLPNFDISRFHFLQPAIWAIAFGAALTILWASGPRGRLAALALALLQCGWVGVRLPWYKGEVWGLSAPYREYFAPALFRQVHGAVDASTALVGNVGLEPAVAQLNGFRTLDAYMVVYPLARKRAIHRIIDAELAKDAELRAVVDHNSNRAYLVSSQLPCMIACAAPQDSAGLTLAYDMRAFAAMGGTHIFSARPILNKDALGLVLIGDYSDPEGGAMKVYVYRYDGPR